MSFAERLQNLPRMVIYSILIAIVVIGLLVVIPLPVHVTNETRMVFDSVDQAPVDRVAWVGVTWSAATQGENRPQTRVIFQHLMARHVKFVFQGFDPQAPDLTQELAEELAPEYGYQYGRDWINLGYRPTPEDPTLKAIVQDIPGTFKQDHWLKKPLTVANFPMLANLHNLRDVGVVIDISPSATYKKWVQLAAPSAGGPYCFACTSVMAAEIYPYIDSKQIKGFLFGIKGAAEYEKLLVEKGILKSAGFTTRAIGPISLALILLFVFIGLGNWSMFATRKAAR